MSCNDPNVNYKSITENFLVAIDKHGPLKKKFIRGNQARFMNRDFQKPDEKISWQEPSREKELAYILDLNMFATN